LSAVSTKVATRGEQWEGTRTPSQWVEAWRRLRRHRIARTLRIARELDVFFRDMRGGAADLHVGSVRLIDPRQRILAFAMTAAAPHALLTVSHDVPVR